MLTWTTIIAVLAGLFSIAGGIFDWDWFIKNRRVAFFVKLFGRMGARIFYVLLGLVFIALGVAESYGLLK